MKGTKMRKQLPVPYGVDTPFCRAAHEERLALQYCSVDDRWQYPPTGQKVPDCEVARS
jgi:hypothetical protein